MTTATATKPAADPTKRREKAQRNVCVWFEIPAADFDRAVRFYETVFETRLIRNKWDDADMAVFPHEQDAVGGCIMHGEGHKPAVDGCRIALASPVNLEIPLARVVKAGGSVAVGKTALGPDMGYFAEFLDTEGNRVGVYSID